MALSAVEQMTHEQMLKEWVENLRDEGYKVTAAALPEFVEKPKAVHGAPAPDFAGKDPQDFPVVGVVKTADNIGKEHTRLELDNYRRVSVRVMVLVRTRDLYEAINTIDCCNGGTFELWVAR